MTGSTARELRVPRLLDSDHEEIRGRAIVPQGIACQIAVVCECAYSLQGEGVAGVKAGDCKIMTSSLT